MTLSKDTLRDLIMEKVEVKFGVLPGRVRPTMLDFFDTIADAVVTHITTDAVVKITTDDSGLQRDPVSSDDTLAPDTEKTLKVF